MKTTLYLPADLVKAVKLRAIRKGKKFEDAVADLLRNGLDVGSAGSATIVKADGAMLKRRKAIGRKFISGEWGVELAGFEASRDADRRSARKRAKAWRD
jgi:plasmid stability protein